MSNPDLFKAAMGIGDRARRAHSLTPLNQIGEGNFSQRNVMSLLGIPIEESSHTLPQDIDQYVKEALRQYQHYHDRLRGRMMEDDKEYEQYGNQTQLVDTIGISPAGPKGKWLMDFRTTRVQNESDTRINVTTMLLDVLSHEVRIIDADRFGGFLQQQSK